VLRAPRSPAVDCRGVADLDAVLGLALEPRWDRTDDGRAVRAPQRVVLRRRDLLDGRVRERRVVEGLHARRVVVVDLRHGGQASSASAANVSATASSWSWSSAGRSPRGRAVAVLRRRCLCCCRAGVVAFAAVVARTRGL
jgi:hypothetical protein